MSEQTAYNIDCMEYMRSLPDKYFDLAVCDPPYGDGSSQSVNVEREREREAEPKRYNRFGGRFDRYKTESHADGRELVGEVRKKIIAWDVAPKQEYFDELFRVSRNQIIWGGNYFSLPPTRCFIVWKKTNVPENFSMAMAEYAWTSFNANAKVFEYTAIGKPDDPRFHPTQKPIELYRWIYKNYAEKDYKIFDSHLGSGSSRIAAWEFDIDFVGCEISKEYFDKQEERFEYYAKQMRLI